MLTFTEAQDALQGTIKSNDQPGETSLQKVAFVGSALSFDFDSGEYGVMSVKVDVAGDAFTGDMTIASFGMAVPFTGTRKPQ